MEKRNTEKLDKDGKNVDVCIQDHHSSDVPSITLQPSDTTILKKQNSVLTSQWRGAEG